MVDKAEVYDLIPGLILVMDTDHAILDLNEPTARAAGKSKDDCIGAKFWDLYDSPGCRAGTCPARLPGRNLSGVGSGKDGQDL